MNPKNTNWPALYNDYYRTIKDSSVVKPFPCVLFALQHALPSVSRCLNALSETGLICGDSLVFGKVYSTCKGELENGFLQPDELEFKRGRFKEAYQRWLGVHLSGIIQTLHGSRSGLVRHGIIVVDDGGFISPIVVEKNARVLINGCFVEQTTAGISQRVVPTTRRVAVASSAVKRSVESIFIGKGVVRALMRKFPGGIHDQKIGVVGLGAVGKQVIEALRGVGISDIYGWDQAEERRIECGFNVQILAPEHMLAQCSLLLGCTGFDCLAGIEIKDVRRSSPYPLFFASCSSSDVEFRTILGRWRNPNSSKSNSTMFKQDAETDAFADLVVTTERFEGFVLNGGFPINLDRTLESDPEDDYILTRLLMFGGTLQAANMLRHNLPGGDIHLLEAYQIAAVKIWLTYFPEKRRDLPKELEIQLTSPEWVYVESARLSRRAAGT